MTVTMDAIARLRALFERDHRTLVGQLADVGFLCARGSYRAAAQVFGEFRLFEERHLKAEAELLDELAQLGQALPEAAARCLRDHVEIERLIQRAWGAITGGDHRDFSRALGALTDAVTLHERTEDLNLLPALEAMRAASGTPGRAP